MQGEPWRLFLSSAESLVLSPHVNTDVEPAGERSAGNMIGYEDCWRESVADNAYETGSAVPCHVHGLPCESAAQQGGSDWTSSFELPEGHTVDEIAYGHCM